jgi:catechol 2,3-dioxygenase-like lactoylglutathione lyase family enzyme
LLLVASVFLMMQSADRLGANAASAASSGPSASADAAPDASAQFTGMVLPVFYVKDVLRSVAFWRDTLGFVCDSFYDYETGGSVKEWTKDIPAVYAEMHAGPLVFAIHRASDPDSLQVGGMIHYFEVADVYKTYDRLRKLGLDVGALQEKPWMNMFHVFDPDGHKIFFYTRPAERED